MKITIVVLLLLAVACYFLFSALVPPVAAHGSCQSLQAEWARKVATAIDKWWDYVKAAAKYVTNPTYTNMLKKQVGQDAIGTKQKKSPPKPLITTLNTVEGVRTTLIYGHILHTKKSPDAASTAPGLFYAYPWLVKVILYIRITNSTPNALDSEPVDGQQPRPVNEIRKYRIRFLSPASSPVDC